jgi:hypothetical protein
MYPIDGEWKIPLLREKQIRENTNASNTSQLWYPTAKNELRHKINSTQLESNDDM